MTEWGAGWFVSDDAGTPTYASFGQEYGFQGQMVVAPEAGLAVVAVGNAEITGSLLRVGRHCRCAENAVGPT